MAYGKFTYPFRYVPSKDVKEQAASLISTIDADPALREVFREGKMLGVLLCEDEEGRKQTLYAFSGLAGGKSHIEGFVPPIFDCTTVPALQGRSQSAEESARLQDWLFDKYLVSNALGQTHSIKEVFARRGIVPPGGTGECAAPKLLNYAYTHRLKPLQMGEFWYGDSPRTGEVRSHGLFYPSCTGKCGPLLSFMLEGLEVEDNPLQRTPLYGQIQVIYEDDYLLAANKPSGMLCSPGLTGTQSLQEYLEQQHGKLFTCHRLDMDTSGVIVYAKTSEVQALIQGQFAQRTVCKSYIAHLCAGTRPWKGKKEGTIALPLSADYYDRPRQMVDFQNGKQAITRFEILEIFPDGEMDVRFHPLTGRTHQLRVHAASPLGLGRPIKGDALYGDASSGRLMLHAELLTLQHPSTLEDMTFASPTGPAEKNTGTQREPVSKTDGNTTFTNPAEPRRY